MEHQNCEAAASSIKDQSRIAGNMGRRDHRTEVRLTSDERIQIERRAIAAGYNSLPQYFRATALAEHVVSATSDERAWLQNINRIGNYVAEIAVRLNDGHQPDDEILLVLMQVQEYVEDVWKEVKQGRATGKV